MNRRAFIAAIAAIPAAALAGIRPPTALYVDALRVPPLEATGGYLLPLWQKDVIAKLYSIPPELIGEPSYSVGHYIAACERQLLKTLGNHGRTQ